MTLPTDSAARPVRRCTLPWALLGLLVVALGLVAWWGYTRRAQVSQYAIASVLQEALGDVVPPGADPDVTARRIAALLRAFRDGRVDAGRLGGGGDMLRRFYADRHLDYVEFDSLLTFGEQSIDR